MKTYLYPINNNLRSFISLDGLWNFSFDPKEVGEKESWQLGLKESIKMPVPGSFQDLFTDSDSRDYTGDFWYETDFFVPESYEGKELILRFGSITHRGSVYVNGTLLESHVGGFLPVIVDVKDVVKFGQVNHLAVKVNNELTEDNMPCGGTRVKSNGDKRATPYFDFFNYSGIQRSVNLMSYPNNGIEDFDTTYKIDGKDAEVTYKVYGEFNTDVVVTLFDKEGNKVAEADGKEGVLKVENAHLWQVLNSYLYTLKIELKDGENVLDEYTTKIGVRTVEVKGKDILINGFPVYLKGYGKHEDFSILGRTFNYSLARRDFECMKWSGANCFRTSHYPYDEGWYQMADEYGFLIIDELPAVGMMKSLVNFVDAGTGKYTYFFESPTTPTLLKNHKDALKEMILRDKNHPSVFAWSLFNEPETISSCAHDYFKEVFDLCNTLDPQVRPRTGALEKTSSPEKCQCYMLCDFISLNRYYGWYIEGSNLDEALIQFKEEMDAWAEKELNVPFIFTEFGTDHLSTMHKLPSIMWSQEYQNEYLKMYFDVFDSYDFVKGELVWNFADFATSQGIFRVNGNNKGVFTRDRQPKDDAFTFKERWEKLPLNYKG